MASKAALKIQRDKEMAAMLYNSKEQRVLEKSLQTLQLEQTYALKLLELDHRIIKVRFKKLKENVSKIKSHLPVDDISNFRDLDLQGKLKSSSHSGVNLGSAIKIAAAARRLNLGAGFKKRSRTCSALPKISVQRENFFDREETVNEKIKPAVSCNDPPAPERIKRCNSITGAFIDAPEIDDGEGDVTHHRPASATIPNHRPVARPQTVNGTTISSNNKMNSQADTNRNNINSKTRINETNNGIQSTGVTLTPLDLQHGFQNSLTVEDTVSRPKTANSNTTLKETLSVPNSAIERKSNLGDVISEPLPTFRSVSSVLHRPRSPFSSHAPTAREARGRMASAPARQRRRLSHISTDSIDSNLGENSHEERRQELLEEEGVRAATLDERTKMFLKDVDEYLIRNPPLQASHIAFENGIPDPPRRDSLIEPPGTQASAESQGSKNGRSVRFRQRQGTTGEEPDISPTFFPEAQYKERLLGLWKDMNKCRYLRVPDDKIDLSGINTLAKDQMKLFETLRSAERPPFKQAWEM
ncbi:protein enl-like isoform x3 [Plakobranchus ocellatus]|uniref:Protein enl-like isoform x3 n=1 Tax=Plakobranchus ocellatus TaxID=259542 RepID=A0AAV3YDT2_9GAST|nr:protein enl-like isoform x3 [Plakobranchus ocellatus]